MMMKMMIMKMMIMMMKMMMTKMMMMLTKITFLVIQDRFDVIFPGLTLVENDDRSFPFRKWSIPFVAVGAILKNINCLFYEDEEVVTTEIQPTITLDQTRKELKQKKGK